MQLSLSLTHFFLDTPCKFYRTSEICYKAIKLLDRKLIKKNTIESSSRRKKSQSRTDIFREVNEKKRGEMPAWDVNLSETEDKRVEIYFAHIFVADISGKKVADIDTQGTIFSFWRRAGTLCLVSVHGSWYWIKEKRVRNGCRVGGNERSKLLQVWLRLEE